jgi:hypothetical protein
MIDAGSTAAIDGMPQHEQREPREPVAARSLHATIPVVGGRASVAAQQHEIALRQEGTT